MTALVLAVLAYSTMQMMVVPAIPEIQRELGASASGAAWMISVFLASTAVATPIAGRMGDMFGKRRVLVVVLVLFCLGSVLGALAPSFWTVIVARMIQGVGGAVFPLAFGVIRDTRPPERVPVAIGLLSGVYGIGGSAGLVLSGVLVDHASWRATFAVGVVLGALALAWLVAFVPAERALERQRIDLVGAALLLAGLLPLLAGIGDPVGAGPELRVALLAAGVLGLGAWARWEARVAVPLIDVRLLARADIWPINAVAAATGVAMYATGFLVPQLAQSDPATSGVGFGASATGTSLLLLPAMASSLVAGPLSGVMARRLGAAVPFVVGLFGMAVGYVLVAVSLSSPVGVTIGVLLSYGIGLNLALAAMATLLVEAAPHERTSEAVAVSATVRMLGGAIGTQLVALLIHTTGAAAGAGAFRSGFVVLAGLSFAGAAGFLAAGRRRQRSEVTDP